MQNRNDPQFMMAKARSELIRHQPFFGTLALRLELRPIENPLVPVMGTDGRNLYYNPLAIPEITQSEVVGVIAHEVLHCAFQHIFRKGHRDKALWNMACDYVVNAILLKERYSLPEGRLYDSQYADLCAEEVYERLLQEQAESGGGGTADGWDFGTNLDPNAPDPETGETHSVSNTQAVAKDWEIATKQAAHIAKQSGRLPGYLESLVEELLQPQIPWQQQLWRFFTQRRPDRITWNRPNRRMIAQGIYLPSRRHMPTGNVVIAVDTSGSISEQELQLFASEIQEVHKALQPQKLYVVNVDTQIQGNIQEYGPYDKPEFKYVGRGGTEFDPVFKWVEEEHVQLDALVYLTDGYASWPKDPGYPVLWCITNHDRVPPWGEHLILEP
jgi:predicted metal-dependent peptidase